MAKKTTAIDISGQRFGMLVALRPTEFRTEKYKGVMWECICDCGKECLVSCGDMRAGGRKSCGCVWKFDPGEAAKNERIRTYKRAAQERNLSWSISDELFGVLTKSNCNYCGCVPSQKCAVSTKWSSYIYNGIDRVDNTRGYEPDNVVACCKICNCAKNVMNTYEFSEWIARVYHSFVEPIEFTLI